MTEKHVTAIWYWFFEVAARIAEPFLFASVLYSAYKLLPAVPQPGAWVDVTVFLTQQLLLDIGGMALLRKAQKGSLPYYVGVLLIAQVVVSVLVASINRVVPLGSVETIIDGVLLVARAVLAVLYGHALYSLQQDKAYVSHSEAAVAVEVRKGNTDNHAQ